MENKRGMTQTGLIFIVFISLIILIVLAIVSYFFGAFDINLSKLDFTVGNMSFNQQYTRDMQPAIQNLQNTGPRIASIGLMIGMIFCLLFVATKKRAKSKLWIIIDIGLIILAEIFAVVVSQTFTSYVVKISPEFLSIYINKLPEGSKFILYLPTIIPTVGALVMVATYLLRRERSEDIDEQQSLEGLYQLE